ncbi:unnamed protein product [Thelazia callipaeda]|uniref:Uncharacterized protein n=1 Tax=Thelazia callipaeda TaxID=103827 RepID=A0A0N5D4Q4_THECL|nr:unnamed protein product [Thelazia callipaeda]
MSESNSLIDLAIINDEMPERTESNISDKLTIMTAKRGADAKSYCPRCLSGILQQPLSKQKSSQKILLPAKNMISEYTLMESVSSMVEKYEGRSRIESERGH